MANEFSGIGPILPTYPVRPGQPVNKDREPGERRKKEEKEDRPPPTADEPMPGGDHDDRPSIDERV